MWNYWKEKYGIVGAMRQQYREFLENDEGLRQALIMVDIAEAYIEARMSERDDVDDA